MKRRNGLAVILALVMIFTLASTALAADYSDTADHWANTQIEKWSDAGILQGNDGKFRPSDPITRGEMAIIIDRIMDYQVTAINSFTDLPNGAYFTEPILKANAAGVILGDAGQVRPKDYITREEAAVMLGRAFGLEASNSGSLHFMDKKDISSWASSMVLAMEYRGFVKGTEGKFLPKNNISRAEVVKIVDNIIKQFITEKGTYNSNIKGTLLVNTAGVILKDMTVAGDLVVAPGVGQGEVALDNVQVNGNLVVKGGGANSIYIKGDSNIGKVIITKVGSEVRLVTGDGAKVENVIINDGSNDVILAGSFGDIQIAAPKVTVNAVNADISAVTLEGEESRIVLDSKSNVDILTLSGAGTAASGEKGTIVKMLVAESTAAGAAVSGAMTVQNARINADNVSVNTVGTKVTVAAGVSGTSSMGYAIAAGTAVTTTVAKPTSSIGGSIVKVVKVALSRISITGEAKADVQLKAVLSPSGARATYQWQRADKANGIYTNIAGATAKTYIPGARDIGKFIKVVAKGTGNYQGSVKSAATAAIAGIKATPIDLGASNPSTVISVIGDTFAAGATDVNNWTIFTDTTGLTVKTITLQGEAGTASSVTIDFEGTATAGTLSIQANSEALSSGTPSNFVDVEIYPVSSVDKTTLVNAISAANTNATAAAVSVDGADVLPADKWVSQEAMDDYLDVIAEAQAVADQADAGQAEVDNAVTALETATSIFNAAKADGTKIKIVEAASFTGRHITSNLGINANGLNMTVSPAAGYHFNADKQITPEIKTALIDSMVFDYTYGLVDQNTGAVAKAVYQKTNLTNLNKIITPYYAKTRVSQVGLSDSVIAWLREYDATQDDYHKLFTWYNNEEYLSDFGRFLAAGPALQEELKARGSVAINADGNLVISCDNSGYLKNFSNVIRLVNGNQPFVFGDLPVSLTVPAALVTEGVPVKTSNTFDLLEIKSHIEIWEYVDDSQAGEAGVVAVNTIYDVGNNGTSAYTPAYKKTHYIKQVAGNVLTEADVRSGGTLGPNGTGHKLIKVVVDGRTGPTWWAFKKPDAQFIYNAFRTNISVVDYTYAADAQTPQDAPEWLKIENTLLTGGPLASDVTFNGFTTSNIYLFNTSGDNRFDEYDVHDMWYTYEVPRLPDYDITADQTVYVNQLCGMTGGSGGGGLNPQGTPFWGMDGRCSFSIQTVD